MLFLCRSLLSSKVFWLSPEMLICKMFSVPLVADFSLKVAGGRSTWRGPFMRRRPSSYGFLYLCAFIMGFVFSGACFQTQKAAPTCLDLEPSPAYSSGPIALFWPN